MLFRSLKRANNKESQAGDADSCTTGSDVVYTIMIRPEDHMVFGAENISRIIKRNAKEIPSLVRDQGLLAWKDEPNGKWRALLPDLLEFNRLEKERFTKRCQ